MTTTSNPLAYLDEWTAEPFLAIAALAIAADAAPLHRHAGCWTAEFPCGAHDRWRVVVNGHPEPLEHGGATVDPFTAVVEYNGWPAAILCPVNGGIFAAGSGANVESFAASVEAEVRRLSG